MTTTNYTPAAASSSHSAGSATIPFPPASPGAADTATPRPVSFAWRIVWLVANSVAWVRVRIDAVVDAVCAFLGPVDYELGSESCPLCERFCASVIPGAYDCTGPIQVADCTVCVERVELTWARRCPNGHRHALANIRPKKARKKPDLEI